MCARDGWWIGQLSLVVSGAIPAVVSSTFGVGSASQGNCPAAEAFPGLLLCSGIENVVSGSMASKSGSLALLEIMGATNYLKKFLVLINQPRLGSCVFQLKTLADILVA